MLFDGTRPVASAGTMQRLVAAHDRYATGLGTWRAGPGGTTTRTYKVSYRLADDNAAQGRNVLVDLRWEAQSVTP
ncbi:hypothetical protein Cma02nite_01110 [Cellulomonas marina]|nr:hypothetical protein Cma02nite_01110 [Cellulomonas marina]